MPPRDPLSAWTYCLRNARRILPTLIILTFVVMIVVVILSTLRGMKEGTLIYAEQYRAYSVVFPKQSDTITPELRREIAGYDAVERLIETRNVHLRLRALIAYIPYALRAVKREDLTYILSRMGLRVVRGRLPRPGTNEVLLHESLMKANEWDLGAEFGMDVSQDDWMPGRWKVVGVLEGETPMGFASFEYVSKYDLYFFALKLRERLLVFSKPGRHREMNRRLEAIRDLRVWNHAEAVRTISQSFDRILLIVDFLSIVQIVVVALVVGLIHNIFFGQRSDEFAILLAVGFTQGRIVRKVVMETATIMMTAWGLGMGLAFAILAGFTALVLTPKGIALPLFQPMPVLVSLALPLVALLFSTTTVVRKLRKFDPVLIIERRG